MLFLLVAIKQNVDLEFVKEFTEEWEKFKLMFHIEGYECKIEEIKLKEAALKQERAKSLAESEAKKPNTEGK